MKTTAFLLVPTALVADVTTNAEYGHFTPWASLSALAVVCGLLTWLVTKAGPDLLREQRAERVEWMQVISAHTKAIEGLTVNCAARAEQYRKDHPSGPV